MAKVGQYSDGLLYIECPGCGSNHHIGSEWQWNEDFDRPTVRPSILVRGTKITDKGWQELADWKAAGKPASGLGVQLDSVPTVCHSFITVGRIEFLNDCTHDLAGQTVDLPDVEG